MGLGLRLTLTLTLTLSLTLTLTLTLLTLALAPTRPELRQVRSDVAIHVRGAARVTSGERRDSSSVPPCVRRLLTSVVHLNSFHKRRHFSV